MLHRLVLSCIVLGALSASASAQQTVLAASRSIDWMTAGVRGGIPDRTTICARLDQAATAAQINAAIAACPAGQVVHLNAGTYHLSAGIVFKNKSGVTLRGAGPNRTFLRFSAGDPCGGLGGDVCFINAFPNWSGAPGNTANWTSGYTAGTRAISVDNTANLQVGSLLILDQLDDGSTDTGEVFACQLLSCSQQGGSGAGRPGLNGGKCGSACRGQTQIVRVTSVDGRQIGISPGLYMPNWRASQSPGAWWSSGPPITASGIEDLSLDHGSSTARGGVFILNGDGIWVTNVRSLDAYRAHVWIYQSLHTTVRDSYFYGTQAAASNSYGIESNTSADSLIENNIFQHIAAPVVTGSGTTGVVSAYNYSIDNHYVKNGTTQWQQPDASHHAAGNSFSLWEANSGIGLAADDIHGTSHFVTAFRNYWNGRDPAGGSIRGKTQSTNAVQLEAYNRYYNLIGNVLGTDGYHTNYEAAPASSTDPGDTVYANLAIYTLGFSGNEGTYWSGFERILNDLLVRSTLYRWGNYDTVTRAVKWTSREVPTGLAKYAQPLPSTQVLPASLYLSSKPAFFGRNVWPPIGPDVTAGDVPNVGEHVYKIPSQQCYERTSKTNGILDFDAKACYSTAPKPPTGVSIVR